MVVIYEKLGQKRSLGKYLIIFRALRNSFHVFSPSSVSNLDSGSCGWFVIVL